MPAYDPTLDAISEALILAQLNKSYATMTHAWKHRSRHDDPHWNPSMATHPYMQAKKHFDAWKDIAEQKGMQIVYDDVERAYIQMETQGIATASLVYDEYCTAVSDGRIAHDCYLKLYSDQSGAVCQRPVFPQDPLTTLLDWNTLEEAVAKIHCCDFSV